MPSSVAGMIGSNRHLGASGTSSAVAVATGSEPSDDGITPNGTWCLGLPGTRFGSAFGRRLHPYGHARRDAVLLRDALREVARRALSHRRLLVRDRGDHLRLLRGLLRRCSSTTAGSGSLYAGGSVNAGSGSAKPGEGSAKPPDDGSPKPLEEDSVKLACAGSTKPGDGASMVPNGGASTAGNPGDEASGSVIASGG